MRQAPILPCKGRGTGRRLVEGYLSRAESVGVGFPFTTRCSRAVRLSRRGRNWALLLMGVAMTGCAGTQQRVASAPHAGRTYVADGQTVQVTGLTALPAPGGQATGSTAAGAVPAGMQYLYGSGEGAAISQQAWRALVRYVAEKAQARPADSVVLAEEATLAAPRFEPCGAKPLAAVFDVDETVLLNLGFESDEAAHPGRTYDEARWRAWERGGVDKVAAVPGAKQALDALRTMGVTVVFNTNRSVENAGETERALNGAGLGPAVHKQTLWLKGDDNTGSLKDVRRWWIAEKYCVVAMGGDQLGDFSDLFNDLLAPGARRAAVSGPIASEWGAGWFVLPNPVYGTALKGGIDELFPADKRWSAEGVK